MRIEVTSEVYSEDLLPDITTEDLLEELADRKDSTSPNLSTDASILSLEKMGCPAELLAPIKEWASGRLSLGALRAVARGEKDERCRETSP